MDTAAMTQLAIKTPADIATVSDNLAFLLLVSMTDVLTLEIRTTLDGAFIIRLVGVFVSRKDLAVVFCVNTISVKVEMYLVGCTCEGDNGLHVLPSKNIGNAAKD